MLTQAKRTAIKLFALVAAAVMALALCVSSAWAEEENPPLTQVTAYGSITINNATIGETYTIYKIFDANPSYTTDEIEGVVSGPISYTASGAVKQFFESQDNNVFDFTATSISDTYNVSVKSGISDESVINFLQGFLDEDDGIDDVFAKQFLAVGTVKATDTTVFFTAVPFGYYFVTSTLGSVVSVDSTNPNVTINDKNRMPEWGDGGKSALTINGQPIVSDDDSDDESEDESEEGEEAGSGGQKISANYGDTIKFQIQFQAMNYNGHDIVTEYYVYDTLSAGMEYVTIGGENKVALTVQVGSKTLTASEYSVQMTSDGTGFKITIPWTSTDDGSFLYGSPVTVTVTYEAKVTDDAAIAGSGNTNSAYFDFDDGTENSNKSTVKTVTTYVYALGFLKIDATDKSKTLAGAEFTVKLGDTEIGAVKNSDGTYSYTTDETVAGYTTTFTTGTDGQIVIKGLAAGAYTVTETKAPDGYNLLTESKTIEASIEGTSTYTETTTYYFDKDGNIVDTEKEDGETVSATYPVNVTSLLVENSAGAELPSTGGMGTTIFYIVGGVLVAGAAVLLITRRRMNASK